MLKNNDYGRYLFFANFYLLGFVLFNQHNYKIYSYQENQLIINYNDNMSMLLLLEQLICCTL